MTTNDWSCPFATDIVSPTLRHWQKPEAPYHSTTCSVSESAQSYSLKKDVGECDFLFFPPLKPYLWWLQATSVFSTCTWTWIPSSVFHCRGFSCWSWKYSESKLPTSFGLFTFFIFFARVLIMTNQNTEGMLFLCLKCILSKYSYKTVNFNLYKCTSTSWFGQLKKTFLFCYLTNNKTKIVSTNNICTN